MRLQSRTKQSLGLTWRSFVYFASIPVLGENERFSYNGNGNIKRMKRFSATMSPTYDQRPMDSLNYEYYHGTNSLKRVRDSVPAYFGDKDIDDEPLDNYVYDSSGSMIKDSSEQIAKIEWTAYGKIWKIFRAAGSNKPDLEYAYDPSGHRVMKLVKPRLNNGHLCNPDQWRYTWYVRDAQGNIMATYSGRKKAEYVLDSSLTVYKLDSILRNHVTTDEYKHFIADSFSKIQAFKYTLKDTISLPRNGWVYTSILINHTLQWVALHDMNFAIQVELGFPSWPYVPNNYPFLTHRKQLMDVIRKDFSEQEFLGRMLSIKCSSLLTYFDSAYIDTVYRNLTGGSPTSPPAMRAALCGYSPFAVATEMLNVDSFKVNHVFNTPSIIGHPTLVYDSTLVICSFDNDFRDSLRHKEYYWNDKWGENSGAFITAESFFGYDSILAIIAREDPAEFVYQGLLGNIDFVGTNLGNYISVNDYARIIRNRFGNDIMDTIFRETIGGHANKKQEIALSEWDMYGRKRLGVSETNELLYSRARRVDKDLLNDTISYFVGGGYFAKNDTGLHKFDRALGFKRFEGNSHLQNNLVTYSDRKIPIDTSGDGIGDNFQTDLYSSSTYYAFGGIQKNKSWTNKFYAFGFNGKLQDIDIGSEDFDFGGRIYDSRLGKWLSIDPLFGKYPGITPFGFCANNPILFVDPDGEKIFLYGDVNDLNKVCAHLEKYFDGKVKFTIGKNNELIMSRTPNGLSQEQLRMFTQLARIMDFKKRSRNYLTNESTPLNVQGKVGTLPENKGFIDNYRSATIDPNQIDNLEDGPGRFNKGQAYLHYFQEQFQSQVIEENWVNRGLSPEREKDALPSGNDYAIELDIANGVGYTSSHATAENTEKVVLGLSQDVSKNKAGDVLTITYKTVSNGSQAGKTTIPVNANQNTSGKAKTTDNKGNEK